MKLELLKLLRCPVTGERLELVEQQLSHGEVETGMLATHDGVHRYPIRNFIPRFVPAENYAANFGLQWNRFRSTQLDSVSGIPISSDRFYRYSGWSPDELSGKLILDVGCGAGRFAEVALKAGARVVALDYSGAVDAARANLASYENLEVVQGDIFALPFARQTFDYVYCLGVLQHTPNVELAFAALPPLVAPGGKLVVDLYPWLWRNAFWSKYWLRPITKRMPVKALFAAVAAATPPLLAVSRVVSRVPLIGKWLRYLIPVVNHEGTYPLSDRQVREWAVLDTFDMFAPAHDHPQRQATLEKWFARAGFADYSVQRMGFVVGRGQARR
jgi:SAM-dependent methyltransferase